MSRSLDRFGAILIVCLCVIWGFNQVFAKLALADIGPIAQTGVRSGIGALCVIFYAAAFRRRVFAIDGTEAAGVLVGVLFTAEFVTLYESLRWITVARATVFIYAAPFFVALGSVLFLPDERLRPIQWAGLAVAFAGVGVGLAGRSPGAGSLFGDLLALIAAVFWAATTVLIKATPLRHSDPLKVLLYQIGVATLITLPAAWLIGEPMSAHPSGMTIAALLWQGAAVVGVSYTLWFWMLRRYAVAELSAFTFLTPLVGVAGGALVFGDRLTPVVALALALVLAGLALVNWPRKSLAV